MIVYDNFWKTLKKKNITQYKLIHQCGISSSLLARLRAGQPISTHTIDQLCKILDCQVSDILSYQPKTNGSVGHDNQET